MATQIYVGLDGKDGTTGTQEQPLRSLQQAVNLAGAGDTVLIRPGIYYAVTAKLKRGGEPGKPLVIEAASRADR